MKNRKVTKNKNYNFILLNSNTHILDDDGLCVCVFICAIFSLSLFSLYHEVDVWYEYRNTREEYQCKKREERGDR